MPFHKFLPIAGTANITRTRKVRADSRKDFLNGQKSFRVELFAMTPNPAFDSDRTGIGKRQTFPN
jgi:hypothetical protein